MNGESIQTLPNSYNISLSFIILLTEPADIPKSISIFLEACATLVSSAGVLSHQVNLCMQHCPNRPPLNLMHLQFVTPSLVPQLIRLLGHKALTDNLSICTIQSLFSIQRVGFFF